MRARALFVCGAALVSGCSFLYASDLDEAREIVILPEGGGSNSSSGGAADGGVTETGTTDVTSVEAAAARGCASVQPAPKFCADFDDGAGLTGWNLSIEDGESAVVAEQSFSSPSSAKVTVKGSADGCLYTGIQRSFDDVGSKRVTVTFRLRMQSPWPDGMIPFVLDLYPGGNNDAFCAALFFMEAPNGKVQAVNLDIQSKVQDNHLVTLKGFPSTDEWAEVKVTVTPNPGGGSRYETTFTDQNGFSLSSQNDFPECPAWSHASIHFRSHCDHRDATMFYDDIRVDWE